MKRRPGRPSIDAQGATVRVGVTLSATQFDVLCRKALREDVSVAEVIRRQLAKSINASKTLTR
jgi:hypothetical protein